MRRRVPDNPPVGRSRHRLDVDLAKRPGASAQLSGLGVSLERHLAPPLGEVARGHAGNISDQIAAGWGSHPNLLPFVINFANAPLQIADLLQILHGRSPASFGENLYRRL